MSLDELLTHELLALKAALQDVPFLIGGGMGLYLRSVYHAASRQPHYPVAPPTRSTKDLDVFLSAAPREVIVDLLTAPPRAEDAERVKRSGIRARPRSTSGIHGRVAEGAQAIERGRIPIDLSRAAEDHGFDLDDPAIYIPSSFNYLVLKLHAFDDRKEDESVDRGRHHAMDIFTTVTDMTEQDWETAREHFAADQAVPYLRRATKIQQELFASESDLGILRMKENDTYRRHREEFDRYIPKVIEDLSELFSE